MPHIEIEIAPQTNIKELVAALPIAADVLTQFGLGCSGCGVSKYETIEQGAKAHGLRVEPIVAALGQARLSGCVPMISNEDRTPARRAPGAFSGRAKIAHVVPIMSGKGGVGKSLVTALLAVGLRRKHLASASSMPTSPGHRFPNSSVCTHRLRSRPIRNAPKRRKATRSR